MSLLCERRLIVPTTVVVAVDVYGVIVGKFWFFFLYPLKHYNMNLQNYYKTLKERYPEEQKAVTTPRPWQVSALKKWLLRLPLD